MYSAGAEGNMRRSGFVYIMTNRSRTLYTGVTSNLEKRVWEHKNGLFQGFTTRYHIDRLVYYEEFSDIRSAIDREKRIKGMTRLKKFALIISMNPEWKDLSEEWFLQHPYAPDKEKT